MYASFYWTPGYDVITVKFIYIDDTPPPVLPIDNNWISTGGISKVNSPQDISQSMWANDWEYNYSRRTLERPDIDPVAQLLTEPSEITSTWGLTHYTTEDPLREARGYFSGPQPIFFTEEMHSGLSQLTVPREDRISKTEPLFLEVDMNTILLQWYYPLDIVDTYGQGIRYSSEIESFNIYRYPWQPFTPTDDEVDYLIATIPAGQPTEWLDKVVELGNDFINVNSTPDFPVGNDLNVYPNRDVSDIPLVVGFLQTLH